MPSITITIELHVKPSDAVSVDVVSPSSKPALTLAPTPPAWALEDLSEDELLWLGRS